LANLPCHDFQSNAAWLEIVLAAADLVAWAQLIGFTGTPELARCEIHAFRYRVLHVAARITRGARQLRLRIDATWRWAAAIATAWQPERPAALGKPAHPGDTGGSNLPQAQNNSNSATFGAQHRRTPPARKIEATRRARRSPRRWWTASPADRPHRRSGNRRPHQMTDGADFRVLARLVAVIGYGRMPNRADAVRPTNNANQDCGLAAVRQMAGDLSCM
jgi:hypothetical protein